MTVYAAGFSPSSPRAKVGILVAGLGFDSSEGLAISELPSGVSLGISAYATDTEKLLAAARISGHEYFVSIPMEPQGYPANDPDGRFALMTSLSRTENLNRLRRALSRFAGYVGVTSALGELAGERLAQDSSQLKSLLEEVGHRGLLYIDARLGPRELPSAWFRWIDVIIDTDPIEATVVDHQLGSLAQDAIMKGCALGIIRVPRPGTLSRLSKWANTLAAAGVTIVPVSALVVPPAN